MAPLVMGAANLQPRRGLDILMPAGLCYDAMRTTLTLDDDVAAHLRRVQRREKISFKDVVNDALRRGLQEMDKPPARRKPVRVRSLDVGRCLLGSIDNVAEVLAVAEGEAFK